jgi:hypothetical protein
MPLKGAEGDLNTKDVMRWLSLLRCERLRRATFGVHILRPKLTMMRTILSGFCLGS